MNYPTDYDDESEQQHTARVVKIAGVQKKSSKLPKVDTKEVPLGQ